MCKEGECTVEVRQLKLGDYLWVARQKGTNRELVLDCIVERKRLDDLGHSIKSDRYLTASQKKVTNCADIDL